LELPTSHDKRRKKSIQGGVLPAPTSSARWRIDKMGRLTKEYQWAIDRLNKELPRWKILTEEFDWGTSLGMVGCLKQRSKNKKIQAFMLEVSGLLPDLAGQRWKPYSLNKDPKKRSALNRIIRQFKELEKT
jgi:hypothetical protein